MTKKSKRKAASRPGWFQTSVRLTDAEHSTFQRAAEAEGYTSIVSWLVDLGRLREKVVNAALDSGEYVEIRGRKVPLSDLPERHRPGQ
jgi:hypothetical protein